MLEPRKTVTAGIRVISEPKIHTTKIIVRKSLKISGILKVTKSRFTVCH